LGFGGISPPKWGAISTKPPKGTFAGHNGSRGVLIMSVSSIVPEKSRGNKKCDKEELEEELRHIFGRKMAVTWLYATLSVSICSYCQEQLQFRFSFVFLGLPKIGPNCYT